MRGYLWLVIIGVIVASAAQGQLRAQEAPRLKVIGCLERGGPSAFLIKDFRSGTPYRLEASAEMLEWHVGHQLEIHGALTAGSNTEGGTLKVESVIYISPTCSQAPPSK